MEPKAQGGKYAPLPLENGNRYQKRLRSWKRKPIPSSAQSSSADNHACSPRKSTIYTYPVQYKHDHSSRLPSTIFSESLTSESAFFSPSISYQPLHIADGLNNNHVTTLNGIGMKRKPSSTSSCRTLSSRSSLTGPLSDPNEDTDSLQLICPRSPTKRSRLSFDQCFLREDQSMTPLDPCTIDINENTESTFCSPVLHEHLSLKAPTSMATAVKMVQPIVDIICNAFEDQLKTTKRQPVVPYVPLVPRMPSDIPYSICPSMMYPCYSSRPLARPITLHSVHFNIQLTSKRQSTAMNLPDVVASRSDHSLSLTFNDLKQRLISKIVVNDWESDTDEHPLKRMMQVAVVGMSALCGYWLL